MPTYITKPTIVRHSESIARKVRRRGPLTRRYLYAGPITRAELDAAIQRAIDNGWIVAARVPGDNPATLYSAGPVEPPEAGK